MKPDYILLRFGELTLKGKNRHAFENKVVQQMMGKLKHVPELKLHKTFGRMYIELNGADYETVAQQLKKTFGLHSFSPIFRTESDLEEIRKTALFAMQHIEPFPKTFKVSSKRTDKSYPHTSQEMNHLVGSHILIHTDGLEVDVHNPEVELHVEVRPEGAFIYHQIDYGLGGLPVGTSDRAMLMLSGGIDSPVAGWLAMKRGVEIEGVHFHSFPYTSERAQQKVIDLTKKLSAYTKSIHLHMVPFTDIQTRLNQLRNDSLLITLMRRSMLRICTKLAEKRRALAIVTGDSLGQVASQTLVSLNVIGRVTDLPLLRPLVGMDKQEIIEISRKIDTYDISILPYEDCCTLFVPKAPSTRPKLSVVENLEAQMDWLPELEQEAVEKTELMRITDEPVSDTAHLF